MDLHMSEDSASSLERFINCEIDKEVHQIVFVRYIIIPCSQRSLAPKDHLLPKITTVFPYLSPYRKSIQIDR
jgi:hypothetical protein